jgi:ABC-type microcin C transport system permease subunit YejE
LSTGHDNGLGYLVEVILVRVVVGLRLSLELLLLLALAAAAELLGLLFGCRVGAFGCVVFGTLGGGGSIGNC